MSAPRPYAGLDIAEHFGREFDRLATHVSLCIHAAGHDHARLVAFDLADISIDPVSLLNVAVARATGAA